MSWLDYPKRPLTEEMRKEARDSEKLLRELPTELRVHSISFTIPGDFPTSLR